MPISQMNGSWSSLQVLVQNLNDAALDNSIEIFISPPSIYIDRIRQTLRKDVAVGAQNCYLKTYGAYTGEIAPEMLKDIGVDYVILGHTERRVLFLESDDTIGQKVSHAIQAGLMVIACIGESLDEREQDTTRLVLHRQLAAIAHHVQALVQVQTQEPGIKAPDPWSNLVIAYEPVWAIGTGKVATPAQAQIVHRDIIRCWLRDHVGEHVAERMRIIYGGSVNLGNAAALAKEDDVDGLFVGGASLKPEFTKICNIKAAI
ncbi:triosephosphate isomerase [Mortierella alpina]|uniref:Triosephosphate isomerase n=1 Tax=Mortierella alpina TaxID=64518 RepID=A0A9P6J9P7_MORAP|nr:triosephosphate isomerase [Mortierella alpina]